MFYRAYNLNFPCRAIIEFYIRKYCLSDTGARRRRRGGGLGEECARRPVGTYLYLHAVGGGNHVAVPCLARWGANEVPAAAIRGMSICREAMYRGCWKIMISVYTWISRSGSPRCFFVTKYSQILSRQRGGGGVCEVFLEKKGTDGSAVGRGCWSWRRTYGKQR
jgi:hypothetical protein